MKNLKITTSELAKICGVSQGTVDRALNERPGINNKTKEKIISVALDYGYRPLLKSAISREKDCHFIGIVVFNLKNEYFTKLIADIEYELKKIGYLMTVMFTDYNKKTEIEAIRCLYNSGVEGIIICSVNSGDEFGNYLKSLNIPVVAVGNNIFSVPYVGIDDFLAMKEQTEFIIKKGYKKIIYFSPAIIFGNSYAQKKRLDGFLKATENCIDYDVITDINNINESYDNSVVIMCSTDYYAIQVYMKTKHSHIIGFDNIDIIKKYNFNIYSVSYSTKKIAAESVNMIMKRKNQDVIICHEIANPKWQ